MCKRSLTGVSSEEANSIQTQSPSKAGSSKKKSPPKALQEKLKKVLQLLEPLCAPNHKPHPKQDVLKSIALAHFSASTGSSSKMIIFASYRKYVEEIVDHLNLESPLLRASPFIGQASTEDGIKGMRQKEQKEVRNICGT